MSQSPITVTYSLEEILTRLEGKIDKQFEEVNHKIDKQFEEVNHKIDKLEGKISNLEKDITDLKVGQAELKTKVDGLEIDVKEIKGSQKAQIWALIGILGTAVLGTIIRYVITALPEKF